MARILIADDDKELLGLHRRAFERRGHQVVTAESAEEALKKFQEANQAGQEPIAVVLADKTMTAGMTGVDLAKAIHTFEKEINGEDCKNTPVILQTGEMGEFEGVSAALPKPSLISHLVGVVEAFLPR